MFVERNPVVIDVAEDLQGERLLISKIRHREGLQQARLTVILGWVEFETTRMSEKMTDDTRPVSTPTNRVRRNVNQNCAMSFHAETWEKRASAGPVQGRKAKGATHGDVEVDLLGRLD